ncbi:MAG TPA: hypothetical protein VFP68_04245 [Burkholderiaceae bacterium]|nr:hypothetical protein [Burkholderiaceae bacterium]
MDDGAEALPYWDWPDMLPPAGLPPKLDSVGADARTPLAAGVTPALICDKECDDPPKLPCGYGYGAPSLDRLPVNAGGAGAHLLGSLMDGGTESACKEACDEPA